MKYERMNNANKNAISNRVENKLLHTPASCLIALTSLVGIDTITNKSMGCIQILVMDQQQHGAALLPYLSAESREYLGTEWSIVSSVSVLMYCTKIFISQQKYALPTNKSTPIGEPLFTNRLGLLTIAKGLHFGPLCHFPIRISYLCTVVLNRFSRSQTACGCRLQSE